MSRFPDNGAVPRGGATCPRCARTTLQGQDAAAGARVMAARLEGDGVTYELRDETGTRYEATTRDGAHFQVGDRYDVLYARIVRSGQRNDLTDIEKQ